jgi:hypothetical protein
VGLAASDAVGEVGGVLGRCFGERVGEASGVVVGTS